MLLPSWMASIKVYNICFASLIKTISITLLYPIIVSNSLLLVALMELLESGISETQRVLLLLTRLMILKFLLLISINTSLKLLLDPSIRALKFGTWESWINLSRSLISINTLSRNSNFHPIKPQFWLQDHSKRKRKQSLVYHGLI